MTQKFVMYSPLYRLEQEFHRAGLKLSRQTMSNWILYASDIWDFCSSGQRFAHWSTLQLRKPASFRLHLTMDALAFGYVLPATGQTRDFTR